MNTRRFVIPDIHGCARTLAALLFDVLKLTVQDKVYFLGDYVDRGPRSKEVLDQIINLQQKGFTLHLLRGNHEEMLLRACGSIEYYRVWIMNGGKETLASFSIEDPCEVPSEYRTLCATLPCYMDLHDCILVHAGLNNAVPDPFSDVEYMLWSRAGAPSQQNLGQKRIISGHTPVSRERIKQSIMTNHILLDNGCVYKNEPLLGTLAALELDTLSLYFQHNID
jgi:serine/threonine protein phosphatase 1